MKRPILPILLLVLVALVIIVILTTCAPQEAPSTQTEGITTMPPVDENPTDTPTEAAPAETPTDMPPPATEEPVPFPEMATEFSVIYALPEGAAYVLTPRREPPGITAEKLVEDPAAMGNQVLGRLTVVQQLSNELPPDDYAITLDPSGETVVFTGATAEVAYPAVIRALVQPISASRPVALISSVQMCIAWDTLQICANASTPLRGDLVEQLAGAIQELGVDPSMFALDRAVPDVEGDNVLSPCLEELKMEQPDYTRCMASVLAVPAQTNVEPPPLADADGAGVLAAPALIDLEPQQTEPEINGTAVLVVLTDLTLTEDAYSDRELTQLIGEIPPGNYLMYDIVLPGDPVIGTYDDQQITESRVGLSTQVGEQPQIYLRSVVGAPYLGEPLKGAPPEGVEAVISNLWVKGLDGRWHCYFRARQCP